MSGPGALSQRTDGGPAQGVKVAPGGEYGSRKEMEGIQSGAPMQGGGGNPMLNQGPPPVPIGAPGDASIPITAGADAGPGIGALAAGIRDEAQVSDEQLRPFLRSLEVVANLPGSNVETRQFVRKLRARLGSG